MGLALPAEWTFDLTAVGGPVSLTIPGAVNVSHILTDFTAEIVDVGAGVLYNPILQLLDGLNVIRSWYVADYTPGPGAQIISVSQSVSIPITPGNSMTLRFNVATVGTEQQVSITGYDA